MNGRCLLDNYILGCAQGDIGKILRSAQDDNGIILQFIIIKKSGYEQWLRSFEHTVSCHAERSEAS
ncbi:MAG: hypothetical protein HOO91_10300 [Bacteroidales bacterium]|nr:hypothetical protein [Bacteroidales bacterium]